MTASTARARRPSSAAMYSTGRQPRCSASRVSTPCPAWRTAERSNASSSTAAGTVTRGSASSSSRNDAALVPRAGGVLLHDAIRLVARQPGLHQAQQHGLAEHQAVARLQVLQHPHAGTPAGPAAGGSCGAARSTRAGQLSGSTMRSTELCEMSRSCHSATSCRPACRLPRSTRESPLIVSAAIGLRLCGIALEPFWPGLKPFLRLAQLGALQMAQLDCDQLHRRPHRGAGVEELGVAVAGDHLGGRHRVQRRAPRQRAARSTGRCCCTCRLHRSACPPPRRGLVQAEAIAIDLQRPQRHLGAERGGLGMDAVGAADHHGVAVLAGDAARGWR